MDMHPARRHHAPRRHRQRRAGVRVLVDHRARRAAVPDQPGPESGAGADRGRAERLRALGQSRRAAERLASRAADRHRRWRRVSPLGTALVSQVNPGWLKFVDLPRAASADPAAGGRLPAADPVRAVGRPRVRRRPRRALFGDDDLRSAAGGDAEQPGARQDRTFARRSASSGLAESTMTAVAYAYAGLYRRESLALIPWILPSIAIGVPIGALLIQHIRPETFRRVCMSFDAWVVGVRAVGPAAELGLVQSNAAYLVLVGVGLLDIWLLYRFFSRLPAVRGRALHSSRDRGAARLIRPHSRLHCPIRLRPVEPRSTRRSTNWSCLRGPRALRGWIINRRL